jgi:hypothetical protein
MIAYIDEKLRRTMTNINDKQEDMIRKYKELT